MPDLPDSPNFAFFYATDAYSTDGKIMGRQSAGKALLKGVARLWPKGDIHALSPTRESALEMLKKLEQDGYHGTLRIRALAGDPVLDGLGAAYYPAPLTAEHAWKRNERSPAAYSLFGVTHTLSSHEAMESVSALVLPPFKPWDGLICTSAAAREVVDRLQSELREWYARTLGATHFNQPAMPIIPLGVNAPDFERTNAVIAGARRELGIAEDEVAFLFAGRLVFHAKANPVPLYQAMEAACLQTQVRLVCIEAGVYANTAVADAYETARREMAPSVRFIQVEGASEADYVRAWRAADVFTSLSDNVQETFGLTPVEAMACGLPSLVSDWNGYRDTIRDGIDGFRVPVLAPDGREDAGTELARRFANGTDTYDFYVGRASMATAVDPAALLDRVIRLAVSPELRREMGAAAQLRAQQEFDWPIILGRYREFAGALGEIRQAAGRTGALRAERRPLRPDPFGLFGGYATLTIGGNTRVSPPLAGEAELEQLLALSVANYILTAPSLEPNVVRRVFAAAAEETTVDALLKASGEPRDRAFRALMWLIKFRLLAARP